MRAIVPFAAERPKTRLADVLTASERRSFADAMLSDVLDALRAADFSPHLLATERQDRDVAQTVDDRPLTEAVNDALREHGASDDEPVAVVMADLALATPAALSRLTAGGDVVIAPGRGGGTNALVVRHPEFRVDYHGASYLDHLRAARDVGASVREVDSWRLATDVDEPEDLVEVLLHGEGASRDWLVDAGFELDTSDGRVGLTRSE
ncbi:2-phospho-L-lactate guanylyltransferase [Halorarum halophilum]|uniref:2-phospho-L-lactate guanylyltransferase n=1 Tax=Halorarum halophilum TaxID=2743090 RepID=A0A7D5GBT7_9EURY|nr:2-phospho-L-lactate guanylyltransferase [Halobaculum halophilum]QLG27665.1 2-phospho-L-lactate guanylyltransferase [Halobaculum halophilum]